MCWDIIAEGSTEMVFGAVQAAMQRYDLRRKAGADPQTYALGLKEVWQVCFSSCLQRFPCAIQQRSDLPMMHRYRR